MAAVFDADIPEHAVHVGASNSASLFATLEDTVAPLPENGYRETRTPSKSQATLVLSAHDEALN